MDTIKNKFTKVLSLSIAILLIACNGDKKFEKVEWNKNPNERYKMTNDLINSNLIIGMNKENVRDLLSSDCKYCDDKSNAWMYYLGEGKNTSDFKWDVLDIEFKNDTVFSVSIRK